MRLPKQVLPVARSVNPERIMGRGTIEPSLLEIACLICQAFSGKQKEECLKTCAPIAGGLDDILKIFL